MQSCLIITIPALWLLSPVADEQLRVFEIVILKMWRTGLEGFQFSTWRCSLACRCLSPQCRLAVVRAWWPLLENFTFLVMIINPPQRPGDNEGWKEGTPASNARLTIAVTHLSWFAISNAWPGKKQFRSPLNRNGTHFPNSESYQKERACPFK
jgi:hypothetical protein